jgi:hypothetical protein
MSSEIIVILSFALNLLPYFSEKFVLAVHSILSQSDIPIDSWLVSFANVPAMSADVRAPRARRPFQDRFARPCAPPFHWHSKTPGSGLPTTVAITIRFLVQWTTETIRTISNLSSFSHSHILLCFPCLMRASLWVMLRSGPGICGVSGRKVESQVPIVLIISSHIREKTESFTERTRLQKGSEIPFKFVAMVSHFQCIY